MALEKALRTWMLTDPTIFTLVSDRIYAEVVPQGKALPAITYRRISTVRPMVTDGQSTITGPVRIQLDIMADTYSEVRDVADAIRNRFSGVKSDMGSETDVVVEVESEFDNSETSSAGEGVGTRRVTMDLIVWHHESAPTL